MSNNSKAMCFALFGGASGIAMYLLELSETDSEIMAEKYAQEINQSGSWSELGGLVKIIRKEYIDDGNGSYRRAQREVCAEAEEIFFQTHRVCGIASFVSVQVNQRDLICLRPRR